ncbi:MAG: hypothetical protein H7Y27_16600 [Gemmatimonadaceae bacterium]|nr:hypothetical protein [Chitinophagaceae bacterium]
MKETTGRSSRKRLVTRIVLFNLALFVLLTILFAASAMILGSMPQKFGSDAAILFVLMVVIHLFLNYIFIQKQREAGVKYLLWSTLALLLVYTLMLFH